ncbi:MAG: choice-of-anchor U domain-containing protein, partial [bacterium]|nr:choice-of-anchor U domain-containing protein [bacterium]
TNSEETTFGLNPNLTDSDQDGLSDREETTRIDEPEDSDGDGMVDAVDPDTDNDGVGDDVELNADLDDDGKLDRYDERTATFLNTQGILSLKLLADSGAFTKAHYDPYGLPEDGVHPRILADYPGLRFEVTGLAEGGTADLLLINPGNLSEQAGYWFYDGFTNAAEIDSKTSGDTISFALTDGAIGDVDSLSNGTIISAGLIAETEPEIATLWEQAATSSAGSGGGGSGCSIHGNRNPYPADGLLLLLPALFLFLRRFKNVG